ncbi:sugar-binding domain-containing protein [Phocaeicola sp.]
MKAKEFILLSLLATSCSHPVSRIDLSGTWQFTTDSAHWGNTIQLPGSMTSNGLGDEITGNTPWTGGISDSSYFKSDAYARYREPGNIKIPFWLQPIKYYKGAAWYKKEITIPADWNQQDISLFLERCHWETRLWVDDKEIGMQNHLGAPHQYDLSEVLTPGKHTLTLRIDNRVKDIDPGENSHSISDHTQGNWNGVVGNMYLQVRPQVNIAQTIIFPDVATKSIRIKNKLRNRKQTETEAVLTLIADGNRLEKEVTLQPGENEVETTLELKDNDIRLWDEFHPNLYQLEMSLTDRERTTTHRQTETFGMRDFKVTDGRITINGRPVLLRGTLDCAAFPKTGYPPTDKDSWKKIFTVCRAHGLNHVRFHSWCPPEAAFCVADEMGIYLEVEASSWANQSTTIGDGRPLDAFIQAESEAIVNAFGNHPSFCMMMYGNEPAGAGSSNYLTNFTAQWKEQDNRRIYCTSAGWPNLPVSDFLSDASPRIQGWGQGLNSIINAQAPRTDYDFSAYTKRYDQPMVSHEIGQWCVYPNFKEMSKYDGVMRPKNFEIFQETLKGNGMEALADSFLLASGKLQALCYKADIEAALRTKDFGGFQLLGLYDFPGQGTALVGVLDAFWEEKGYISPEEYSRFCNSTVPLARLPKLVYTNNEKLIASAEIAHYGDTPLKNATAGWSLSDVKGNVIQSGKWQPEEIPVGNNIPLGEISASLSQVKAPQRLVLEVFVNQRKNDWNIWVYPSAHQNTANEENIRMTDRLDKTTLAALEKGATVLLSLKKGTLAKEMGGDIAIGFSSIFWNTAWTGGQAPHTLGILCNPKHPALSEFPTEYHSDYQWWDAMSHSGAIEFAKISPDIQPVVRVIDDWFTNRPLALVFEVKVGNGKLLVSGIDFWQDMDKRPEARQLLHSLKKYITAPGFNPTTEVKAEQIKSLIDN